MNRRRGKAERVFMGRDFGKYLTGRKVWVRGAVHSQVVGNGSRRSRRFASRCATGSEFPTALLFRTVKRAEARAPNGSDNFGMHRSWRILISPLADRGPSRSAAAYLV